MDTNLLLNRRSFLIENMFLVFESWAFPSQLIVFRFIHFISHPLCCFSWFPILPTWVARPSLLTLSDGYTLTGSSCGVCFLSQVIYMCCHTLGVSFLYLEMSYVLLNKKKQTKTLVHFLILIFPYGLILLRQLILIYFSSIFSHFFWCFSYFFRLYNIFKDSPKNVVEWTL